MHSLSKLILPVSLLLVAGCTTPPPEAALPTVKTQVMEHAGVTPSWPLTPEEHAQVDTAVRDLLATNLTAESVVQIALLNNRTLRATFEELGLSQAGLAAASRLPNPSFDASVRWPSDAPRGPNAEFGISLPLLDSLLMSSRKGIAQKHVLQTQYRVSHEVLALVAEVRGATYELQALLELRKRLGVIMEINAAAADLGRRQFEAGNISSLDQAQLNVSTQQMQFGLIRAETEIHAAREHINRLLGLSGGQVNWNLATELPALPAADQLPDNLEAIALQQRLDLAALRAEAELAQIALEKKRNTRLLPGAVDLGASTERDSDGSRVTGPTLSLELPLFDQGQPEIARLAAIARQTQDRAEAMAAEIGSEVRLASARLGAARQSVDLYKNILLPQRQAILRESLLHYNAMQKSIYELLAAKEQQQLAERESVESLRDYWLARTELERALGIRLPAPVSAAVTPSTEPAVVGANAIEPRSALD